MSLRRDFIKIPQAASLASAMALSQCRRSPGWRHTGTRGATITFAQRIGFFCRS